MLIPLLTLATALHLTVTAGDESAARHSAEVQRIQRHFDGAIALLESSDVSALSPSQLDNRRTLTERLRHYRDRGAFPRNYDFPGEAVPYFVDRRTGVVCAVGHLIESTGHRDLVDRVAAADNNVWVAELAGDDEFRAWLDEQGLTLDEAARIQVPYMGEPPPMFRESAASVNTNAPTIALGAALGTAALAHFNANLGQRRSVAFLGAAVGAVAIATGAGQFKSGGDQTIGSATVIGGLASLFVARQTFGRFTQARRTMQARDATLAERTRIAPMIPIGGPRSAGLSIAIAF